MAICFGRDLAFGQSNQLNTVIPPSPRSREFEKFINYPVSLYNGLPQIGINFYTIELGSVKIPIGIAYHASGIKFGQTSGDVGLGWGLEPGFRVSRTVHGRLDEAFDMPDMNNIASDKAIGSYLSSFTSKYDRDRYLARYMVMVPGSDIPAVAASQNDYLDGQYDLFTIGMPGNSGNFIISNRQNKTVTVLDNAALQKISYATGDIGIAEFNTTDGSGIQYQFGVSGGNTESHQVYINGTYRKFNTAWLLGKVNTPFNDSITFQYQPFTEASQGMPGYSRTFIEGDRSSCGDCITSSDNNNKGEGQPATIKYYYTQLLTGIISPNEVVTLSRNINGSVNTITIANRKGVLLKKVTFFYSSTNAAYFLDSLQVAGADNVVVEKYGFDYTSKDVLFPNYDCFGYGLTNPGGGESYCNYRGQFKYHQVGIDPYEQTSNNPELQYMRCTADYLKTSYIDGTDKRLPALDAGMLKRITYPTGGTQQFVFENNNYEVLVNGTLYSRSGGGFRIGAIISDDKVSGTTMTTRYIYNHGQRSFDPTDPSYSITRKVALGILSCSNPRVYGLNRTTFSAPYNEEVAEALTQEHNGWYTNVRVENGVGATEYKYAVSSTASGLNLYPLNGTFSPTGNYCLQTYNYWNKPYLQEKSVYEVKPITGNTIKQKETYEYTMPSPAPLVDEFTGLKVAAFGLAYKVDVQSSPTPTYDLYESGLQSVFNYLPYTITSGEILLRKKTTTVYDMLTGESSDIVSEYSYTYANLPATEKVTNSKGEVIFTSYKYPLNFTGISATDAVSAGVKQLQRVGAVTPVIEKSTYRANADMTNKRLISSLFFSYKPDAPLLDKVFRTDLTSPALSFTESGVQGGVVTKDNIYKESISFDTYDVKGNILQQSKTDDVKEVYFWGYNNKYPVAKIMGSDYNTAKQYVDQSILDNAANFSDAAVQAELGKLRTGLSTAMVSTYTYRPLVGMGSATDPMGKTTYYDYDYYGRLKAVRDNNSNIVRQYDYQYQAPSTPVWFNTNTRQTFTRNDCTIGGGTAVEYVVPERTYYSNISQADADQKAQNDIKANGQAYANKYGSCIFFKNERKSQWFTRSTCTADSVGSKIVYEVPGGTYTSAISQADADQQALNGINLNGQTFVNQTARCLQPVYAKLKFENIVQSPTSTIGDVVVRFYSDGACTVPLSLPNSIVVTIKSTKVTTPDNTTVITTENYVCSGSSTVLKAAFLLSDRQSQAPGAPATNYTFTLQNGYGYTVR
ncbi:MAG: hypothetical protein JO154_25925 [Chitinophaga sp.]|nr:hypothetical protein [Chitinophaga sp.]